VYPTASFGFSEALRAVKVRPPAVAASPAISSAEGGTAFAISGRFNPAIRHFQSDASLLVRQRSAMRHRGYDKKGEHAAGGFHGPHYFASLAKRSPTKSQLITFWKAFT
jgi:hypothetical protein